MTNSDLIKKIRQLDRMTPGETQIADYICQRYPEVAFENVTSISQKAGVSKATVVRFIKRLGYDGFSHFHERLHGLLLNHRR